MTDDDTPLPPHGRAPMAQGSALLPCHWCSTPTQSATLAQYGARCFRCYEAYCRAGPSKLPRAVGNKAQPRSWALALQERERAGEALTPEQKAAWRDALAARSNLLPVAEGEPE